MHNFNMTSSEWDSQTETNMQIIEDSLNDASYRKVWDAGMMSDAGEAAAATFAVGAAGTRPARWVLADAVTSGVCGYCPRHPSWKSGYLSLRVIYAVSAANNQIAWRYAIGPHLNLAAATNTTISETKAAPASADVLTYTEFHTAELNATSKIDTSHLGVSWRVGRRGATDSNNGDLYIYSVELIYNEGKRVIGVKGK